MSCSIFPRNEEELHIKCFPFLFVKREEILALCVSNPEVIAYIVSLESQI